MSRRTAPLFAILMAVAFAATAWASGFSALARIDPDRSEVRDVAGETLVTLDLSVPVPWRAFTLTEPDRLVLDFRTVAWGAPVSERSARVERIRTGDFAQGWSRMVLDLAGPSRIAAAALETGGADGRALLTVRLEAVDAGAAALASGAPPSADFPVERRSVAVSTDKGDRIRVVLDPGHGGIDPGAFVDGIEEAELMLTFAAELREVLLRAGAFEVIQTREADVFVPLEHRISVARAAGADAFLSLHADALAEDSGRASGATVYTLSDEASDSASARLAERHDASDLLAGVDLSGRGDEIALVLMEMARRETAPRSLALASALVAGIQAEVGKVNSRPLRAAGFSVLKSPDIPSVLIELGFLSSPRDRERLSDPEWRAKAAAGIRDALLAWAEADARLSARR